MNLALKQIKSDNVNQIFSQEPFFSEYFKVFRKDRAFDENAVKSIQQDLDINRVIDLSDTLISIFKNKSTALSQIEMGNEIGLIIFIGDGNIDGHSIILDDSAYVFVDLKTIILRSHNNFDLDSFLSHEIIHALHYDLNKEFYPKNYTELEDTYLKTLIVEGMATNMSMCLFGLSENLGYWLGLLEANEINNWISNCKKMKTNMGVKLKESIANKEFDKSIYDRLFYIKKSEKFTLYRMGYYYGSEIIKEICNDTSMSQVFRLKFSDTKKYINKYFEIIIS